MSLLCSVAKWSITSFMIVRLVPLKASAYVSSRQFTMFWNSETVVNTDWLCGLCPNERGEQRMRDPDIYPLNWERANDN